MSFFLLEMLYLWEITKIQKNNFSRNFVSIFFSFPQDKFEEFLKLDYHLLTEVSFQNGV